MSPQQTWQIIPDNTVQHVWRCDECDHEFEIPPAWYQQNGTPVCPHCDIDAKYERTEVWLSFVGPPVHGNPQ